MHARFGAAILGCVCRQPWAKVLPRRCIMHQHHTSSMHAILVQVESVVTMLLRAVVSAHVAHCWTFIAKHSSLAPECYVRAVNVVGGSAGSQHPPGDYSRHVSDLVGWPIVHHGTHGIIVYMAEPLMFNTGSKYGCCSDNPIQLDGIADASDACGQRPSLAQTEWSRQHRIEQSAVTLAL